MKVFFLKLILIVLIVPDTLWSNQCLELFASVNDNITSDNLSLQAFTITKPTPQQLSWTRMRYGVDYTKHSTAKTVDILNATLEQKTEGIWLIVKKQNGKPWYSRDRPFIDAPHGDPRWVFHILGTDVAAILGFSMPDANTVIIPTVERINWGIALLNAKLKEHGKEIIPYTYYEQKDSEDPSYARLASEGKIPINSANIWLAIHDISYHITMVSEPAIIAKGRFLTLGIFNRYVEFLSSISSGLSSDVAYKLIDFSIAGQTVIGITIEREIRKHQYGNLPAQWKQYRSLLSAGFRIWIDSPLYTRFLEENKTWLDQQKTHVTHLGVEKLSKEQIIALMIQRRRELAATARQLMPQH